MYPGTHNLGSRSWVSVERIVEPPLGEWSGERTKKNGRPPLRVPLPLLIGSADCIAHGEKPDLPRVDASAACAKVHPDLCFLAEDLFRDKTNVFDCVFARLSAFVIGTAYANLDDAAAEVQTFLGPDAVVTPFEQPTDFKPAGIIGVVNNTALVWLTGTTTFEQLAVQAFYFGRGPINQGGYSASVLYEDAALAVAAKLNDVGAGTIPRVVLIGHSYGGAVAMVLAAKMRLAGPPEREIEILTLGAPQPGDQRLHDIILNLPQTHWVNQRDPIPFLPPKGITVAALALLVSPVLALLWRGFVRPPNVRMITQTGDIVEVLTDDLPDDSIYTLGLLIAQGLNVPKFKDHNLDWYLYYICLACKCVPRPCIEPDIQVLNFELVIEGLEVTVDGVPAVVGFSIDNALLPAGGSSWVYPNEAFPEVVIQTTGFPPFWLDPFNVYFRHVFAADRYIEVQWFFSSEAILRGIETGSGPDIFSASDGGIAYVSFGSLKVVPILL